MDVKRLGKNFSYSVRCLPDTGECNYVSRVEASLLHHFDIHTNCGDWCACKKQTEAMRKKKDWFYRSTSKDAALYEKLWQICGRFFEFERLKELDYGMDTNMNESLNNTIFYLAPKNRVFCTTCSLQNRVAMAVRIVSLGFKPYFVRLLTKLGIQVTTALLHFLEVQDKARNKRLQMLKDA